METAFDIISLVLFIVVILLAFFRKVNVGVVAVTFGVIMVRIFGLTDKDLIGGFSSSMFTTLVGITLLFAAITQTGALDLLARKIIALAMAALATALPGRTKEDENKTFVDLFIYAALAIVILTVLCATIYVPLANLLHGA